MKGDDFQCTQNAIEFIELVIGSCMRVMAAMIIIL